MLAPKEQTAFRFEPTLISMMKRRAKALHISVNAYVTGLIECDLRESHTLPQVELPEKLDDDIAHYAGILRCPSEDELAADERLMRIWQR